MRRHVLGAVLAAVVLAAGAACAPEPEAPQVEVGGDVGQRPQVHFDVPHPVTETTTETIVMGDGAQVEDGRGVLFSYLGLDATTGETLADSYSTLPDARLATEDELGADLYDTIVGVREGSRVLRQEVGTVGKPDPVVLVVDILPTRAVGEPVEPPAGLPTVALDDVGAPTITIPDGATPPSSLTTATLIRGSGPQVATGQSVSVQFTAVRWSDGSVFDSTWESGGPPQAKRLDDALPGWRTGIVDQTVGSQVLMVIPPELGNGVDTLVYVVDILAVADDVPPDLSGTDAGGGGESPEPTPTPTDSPSG
ncbi:peptidylprolyl isomerase FKBP-type [Beutenbergia cavernae DSM 12333]|uniref:Peptidyl-prolyl cis-trans isomerase n=1 Tax=Beutenbergia cavernae (strain ATCC BAA-8 / DSM 12333 / CCUG 43141 / JCM 11478 / NBRC 16432 / NCIMB 13614 / HKI 0122) TaxID=471853 RepID=C5BVA0_BEUC1|nr:FKBP-type peptidyl-prolyl cis-trans isomerase [Beutenbergia cavernae]ACQ80487.1 peptidylprolyl isomerase FKBP-type [Beutenbergia cavernae DSM 12333]